MATFNDLEYLQNDAARMADNNPLLFNNSNEDYRSVLETYGISYQEDGYYLQVGKINKVQGWILHMSVSKYKFCELINIVIPILLHSNIPFKIPATRQIKDNLSDGIYGYTKLGKVCCIYPHTDAVAIALIKKLSFLSSLFDGPAIPTDIKLSNIIYTRYGSFAPIVQNDKYGLVQNYIYNLHHQLIIDPYYIPFKFPKGIVWPFSEIAAPTIPQLKKIYKGRYIPYIIIKSDAKGRVIKAINISTLSRLQYCIIKEGKKCICTDEYGRDSIDKLIWQRDLHRALSPIIPLPKIIDYFEEDDNAYLIMEFIDGQSLDEFQEQVFKNRSWLELQSHDKVQILDQLIKIIGVIEQLHELGYVHRDITIPNFMIDKKGEIVLIDMELAYDIWNRVPYPHFDLGTPGSMSPEQLQSQTPTYAQDIYGLGTLLLLSMIRLWPIYFETDDPFHLYRNLLFFINDEAICLLIAQCLSKDPADRPGIQHIKDHVINYKRSILAGSTKNVFTAPATAKIKETALAALNGLFIPDYVSQDELWHSMPQTGNQEVGKVRKDDIVFLGLHEGISGVIYLISEAHKAGFTVAHGDLFKKNLDHLINTVVESDLNMTTGIYAGASGVALALLKAQAAGIVPEQASITNFIKDTLLKAHEGLDIAGGMAGQGLVLLHTPIPGKEQKLRSIVDEMIELQRTDGSWYFLNEKNKQKEKIPGFSYGVSGVIFFLFEYYQQYKDKKALTGAEKGLRYLIKKVEPMKANASFSTGCYGIALAFIKAFETTRHSQYRSIAEQLLKYQSPKTIDINYTQSYGLSGIGEVYLEAYKVFKAPEWKERADWIAGVFVHTAIHHVNAAYWLIDNPLHPHADLMIGNSGIIHYLLRYLQPEKIGFIIFS